MTNALTRERVLRILGEIDDHTIARIIATGADEVELREAIREVELQSRAGESLPRGPDARADEQRNVRIDQLYEILFEIEVAEDDSLDRSYD
jgi:hypothetical protein